MTEIQKKLESYITAEMNDWDFSGVVRIIQNGRILSETCRGYSNIEFGIKNTMETKFMVASVTKQFTAFAIMIKRRFEEQQTIQKLISEGDIKPSVWGYELISKQFV